MFFDRATIRYPNRAALLGALAALTLSTALAVAQEPPARPEQQQGFIAAIDRWLSEQASNLAATFKGAGKQFEEFGDKANDAARTTYKGAQDTAEAVTRIPGTRVVTGHARCQIAPNGAPDCLAAATAVCKAKGFESGKSLDMTTSEICPAEVYLAGRRTGPDCHTETFVSRALCQ